MAGIERLGFERRSAEFLMLEMEIGQPIVDRRRLRVFGEGVQIGAVPVQRLLIIGRLLLDQVLFLVERVIMVCEVPQVGLEVGHHLGRIGRLEVVPVVGLEAVPQGEILLRFQHQFRETPGLVDLDHPHAELR